MLTIMPVLAVGKEMSRPVVDRKFSSQSCDLKVLAAMYSPQGYLSWNRLILLFGR